MSIETVKSNRIPPPSAAYSQAVKVRGGSFLFISGQVSKDSKGNDVAPADFEAQARRVFENLKLVVEEAGGSVKDIFKLTVMLTDQAQWKPFSKLREEIYKEWGIQHPATTLFVVKDLAKPEWMIEIEAIALLKQ